MLNFNDLWALEKRAISPFVQSWNINILSLTVFEPRTLRVTAGSLNHYTKFPYKKIFEKNFRQILRDFCNLSVTESPVESSNNRRFLSKRQKIRIINNFSSKSNFCMKFSKSYEKVHNLPAFGRILYEKVVHLKSDVHYCSLRLYIQTY